MSSQTDKPPAWGTLAYWEWVKERYLSEKQCRFARILAEEAECGRAYVLARRAELQDADAQEVAQEYCMSIFQARPTYDARRPLSAFLNTILYRAIIAHRRRLSRWGKVGLVSLQPKEEEPVWLDQVPSRNGTPLDEAISGEELARIRECLGKLESSDAEILILRYIEEFTTGQIAELLGLARGAVHARLFRARSRLRALLTGGES